MCSLGTSWRIRPLTDRVQPHGLWLHSKGAVLSSFVVHPAPASPV
jgi:hypothetical protein